MNDSLQWWVENLPEAEAQLLLLRAAKEHSVKFTNPDMIGMEWAKTLRTNGYNALGPYARNYLAFRYLTYHEDLHTPRWAAVS